MNEDAGKQKVVIFTPQFEIRGSLNIYQGVRLTDYMNESNSFISVTDVQVKLLNGAIKMRSGFLNVRKDVIELILPEDSVITTTP